MDVFVQIAGFIYSLQKERAFFFISARLRDSFIRSVAIN